MLTNGQYQEFMREYASRRDRNRLLIKQRREEVRARIPAFRDLDDGVSGVVLDALKRRLLTGPAAAEGPAVSPARAKIADIAAKKRMLLKENGYPEDYLDPVYDCPDCRDTGYIEGPSGSVKCHCLRQMELGVLFDHSRLSLLLKTNNFSLMREDLYEGASLELFRRSLANCRSFIDTFDTASPNLLFYGPTGTGKSFLSICVAGEILQKGCTVLYFSAADLLERVSAFTSDPQEKQLNAELMKELTGTQLLVLDDLGTEINNSYVSSKLFTIINERILNGLSTIISTNLSLEEIRARYSDRVFSRITSSYMACKLTGPDIRMRRIIRK